MTVLTAASSGVCIISSASVVGAPVGIVNANFTLIFSLTTGIIKKVISITRNKKNKLDKILILAKSRLSSIETLVSQALIDMQISHEEFNVIIKENEKYERMKKNVRNVSEHNSAEKQENIRLNSVNLKKNNEFVTDVWAWNKKLSEKQSNIIKQLHHQKCSDLALKIIDRRTEESCNLKRNLGFRLHGVINTKEQTAINVIKDAFEGEDMQTPYSLLGYRINLYFHKHKLVIEVDELGHADRNLSDEIERQKMLEKELDCMFIRINPDGKNFIIFREINKIHRHITKKLLIDDLSKRLLELEFKSNHSIKSKCLNWIVKKMLPAI